MTRKLMMPEGTTRRAVRSLALLAVAAVAFGALPLMAETETIGG